MTVAICIHCGAMKWGAWGRCSACGFLPSTSIERAKSLLATDHYFSIEYLQEAGRQMKDGRPLVFLESQVEQVAKGIEKQSYFLLNFTEKDQTIPCMKCGKRFATDDEKEEVLCPSCALKE